MSVLESLPLMLFVILMVFAVLASLFLLIQIFTVLIRKVTEHQTAKRLSKVTTSIEDQLEPSTSSQEESEPVSDDVAYGGELVLRDVDEPTAALIMAIVSDETKIPISELCFRSIRKKA